MNKLTFILILAAALLLTACNPIGDRGDDTDTQIETKKAVTTPPITSPASTAGDIVYGVPETEIVHKWTFEKDGTVSTWKAQNAVERLKVEGGILPVKIKANDPYISTSGFPDVNCEDIQFIVLEINNRSSSMAGQIFFMTEDNPSPSEAASFAIAYSGQDEDNDEWEEIWIYTGNSNWYGKLISFRFDVSNGSSGVVNIRSIALAKAL